MCAIGQGVGSRFTESVAVRTLVWILLDPEGSKEGDSILWAVRRKDLWIWCVQLRYSVRHNILDLCKSSARSATNVGAGKRTYGREHCERVV